MRLEQSKLSSLMIPAHAKANLSLDVLGIRNDGYHDIRSVMVKLCLHDRVYLYPRASGITLACSTRNVPWDHRNLAHRAAVRLRRELGVEAGVHLFVEKHIPVAAGLAGGSADAAAVLWGLNRLWGAGLTVAQLQELGESIGSDVPFCIQGTCALVTGRGEQVEELAWAPAGWVVLARPGGLEVPAAQAYAELDRRAGGRAGDFTPGVMRALARGGLAELAAALGNGLEAPVMYRWPEVGQVKRALLEAGAVGACLSGSGPVVLGLVDGAEQGELVAGALARQPGMEAWVTRFLDRTGGG
ncbi:MAG TPA: 4-(cytidine 5'-diphospho)-2-C-methyl-D-erythritol kinase [Clostridiales bacterium UBA8153]|nr:4-(cytidine 5'-diphospho)-2-C-methyl-D-erythritol kinase [Clostridiales bacterium UBA8153]